MFSMVKETKRTISFMLIYLSVAASGFIGGRYLPQEYALGSGKNILQVIGMAMLVLACCAMLSVFTQLHFARRNRPAVEGLMLARIYWLIAWFVAICAVAYGFGVLGTFGTAFSMFGGMLLGWSLQAPVSGFAAWILVSIKRPFRPGDRVQFPTLASLTGDVMEIGPMYTVLNQVGGAIASEEAVGRHVLVPNAMLFGQVIINYTARREASFMLDEVLLRITYDSDWAEAENILLAAAHEVTEDIITITGDKPYIRADSYDYGIILRLRYKTRVKDRAETSYKITKRVIENVQRAQTIDLAIPFVYSYRSGHDKRVEDARRGASDAGEHEIEIARIKGGSTCVDPEDVDQLSISIASEGLLQPIVVKPRGDTGDFDILAGELRLEACKRLGWKTVRAIIHGSGTIKPMKIPGVPDSAGPVQMEPFDKNL